ncbi:ABC transporter ATP-binding protein [Francisella sp. SYW-2]|uniref:ABC transporter ATP-binding protein n=1 Tax=Francisella sp. SYW-2 TaxID=2610886 RepID=UPI00168D550A|nr:ABC transporter ATP-binding protein [Francisella sp. SYW-2]
MRNNIAIEIKNLTKSYKLYDNHVDRFKESIHPFKKKYHHDFFALNNVSFTIRRGEVVGIIGRNGSGKSTLLKMITGVLTPTSGSVVVNGRISAILELGGAFNPEYTGMENIYLYGMLNGRTREEMETRLQDILNFADIGEHIHQPVKTYSSGMSARLAFAVSINIEPDVLIVDEALAVGDTAFQRKCFAKMEEIKNSGATILFVSHSEQSIVNLCDRAIWLSKGDYIIDGSPKLVTSLYMKHFDEAKVDRDQIIKEFTELKNSKNKEIKKSADDKHSNLENSVKEEQNIKIIEDFYDPSLKPQSTVYYEEKGAKISNVKITTVEGKEVNVLTQGVSYAFCYDILFRDLGGSYLAAMMIKNVSGYMYGGGHYPERLKYTKVTSHKVEMKWYWECNLVSGEYFFNCGVRNESGFMHRILDSYCFRVLDNEDRSQSIGPIDFKIKVDVNVE